MAPAHALALAVWLAPAWLTRIGERTPGRPSSRAVMLFGLAACAPRLIRLWMEGASVDAAVPLVLDRTAIATVWAAQVASWLALLLLPAILTAVLETSGRRALRRLRAKQRNLQAEWTLSEEARGAEAG